ncbi:MAG: alpha-E domain-containing protein [Saprospiraceae bacterium]
MLSRVADSIFWIARYMERTNGMLRLLRTSYISSQDEIKNFSWLPILGHYSDQPLDINSGQDDSIKVIHHLLLDKENDSSVINNITRARENARAVQDHITKEVWQCLNDFYHLIRHENTSRLIQEGDIQGALDSLIAQGWLYYGVVDTTMARGNGFSFLSLGKFMERALLSTDSLSIKLEEIKSYTDHSIEIPALRYLLYSLSGYELFLKSNRGTFKSSLVFQQIILNPHFPHSILYCLVRISRYLQRLQPESLPEAFEQLDFLTGKLMNNVKYAPADIQKGTELDQLLDQTRTGLFEITNALNKFYFGHF